MPTSSATPAPTSPARLPRIESRIVVLRGLRLMIDADLAALCGVTTQRLTEQVKRNPDRFPGDFMFKPTPPGEGRSGRKLRPPRQVEVLQGADAVTHSQITDTRGPKDLGTLLLTPAASPATSPAASAPQSVYWIYRNIYAQVAVSKAPVDAIAVARALQRQSVAATWPL